jgi:hypothetical protein
MSRFRGDSQTIFRIFFFFALTTCNGVKSHKSFRGTYWIHLHGRNDEVGHGGAG